MGRKTNQKLQHAAARRELEDAGVSQDRIAELERDWDEHTARLGRVDPFKLNRSGQLHDLSRSSQRRAARRRGAARARRRVAFMAQGLQSNSF